MKNWAYMATGALLGAVLGLLLFAPLAFAHGLHGPNGDHELVIPAPTKLEVVFDDRGVFGQTCEVRDRAAPCCAGQLNAVGDVRAEGELCLPAGFPVDDDLAVSVGIGAAGGDTRCEIKADGKVECRVAAAQLQCAMDDMRLTLTPLGGDCYSYKIRGTQQYITAPSVFSPPNHEWSVFLLFISEPPGVDVNTTGLFLQASQAFPATDFKCLNDSDRRQCGDANGNGSLNISDALVVLRTSIGAGSCGLRSCDLDGSLDIRPPDALHDLRAVVGLTAAMDCPHTLAFVYSGPVAGAVQFDVTYMGDTLGDCSSTFLLATNDDDAGFATIGVIDLDGVANGDTVAVCENLLNPDEVIIEHLQTFAGDGAEFVGGSITAVLR